MKISTIIIFLVVNIACILCGGPSNIPSISLPESSSVSVLPSDSPGNESKCKKD